MVPTLHDGDLALVWVGAPVRSGDVVLARFRSMPDRYVVKRAVTTADGGWLLRSDNPFAGGDSATHGVADPTGRVVLRWPSRSAARWLPRLVRRG
jgi:phage repressor protein C with HTH and peptisase S24 domain